MKHSKPALFVLAIAAVAFAQSETLLGDATSTMGLKEERIIIEYSSTIGEYVVIFEAESESPLVSVGIQAPNGQRVLDMKSDGQPKVAVSGFIVETLESKTASLLASYPEGLYELRASTHEGRIAKGSARLSHTLLPAPEVIFPAAGITDVEVEGLTITWIPDPNAVAYQVILEQGESDTMSVTLPGTQNSLTVPRGVLAPNTDSHVEIGAIGENGNRTLTEVEFKTR